MRLLALSLVGPGCSTALHMHPHPARLFLPPARLSRGVLPQSTSSNVSSAPLLGKPNVALPLFRVTDNVAHAWRARRHRTDIPHARGIQRDAPTGGACVPKRGPTPLSATFGSSESPIVAQAAAQNPRQAVREHSCAAQVSYTAIMATHRSTSHMSRSAAPSLQGLNERQDKVKQRLCALLRGRLQRRAA